jgi:hypothetical protein
MNHHEKLNYVELAVKNFWSGAINKQNIDSLSL